MTACTFFGHRDCPSSIKKELSAEIEKLIAEKGVDTFYVGTHGNFDRIAYTVLKGLQERNSHIKIYRVLAYMPKPGETDTADTIVPEGIENTHPRYAIVSRNNWMIDHSDYVIAYVTRTFGGAYQSVERARKKGKIPYPNSKYIELVGAKARLFLQEHFQEWIFRYHHRYPYLFIDSDILSKVKFERYSVIVDFAIMNAFMICKEYSIVLFDSEPEANDPPFSYRNLRKE